MEDYNNIIEGILYLKGDEGIDIKELSLILEISKKEAVEAMDHFIEAYSKRGFDGLQVVDFGGKYKHKAELVGGIILVLLGVRILIQHLSGLA